MLFQKEILLQGSVSTYNQKGDKVNYSNLIEVVDAFKGKKLMVIGDLLLDHIIRGEVSRISPEAPVPVVWAKHLEDEDEYMPGGACNVARNLSTLGADVLLVGVVGDDKKADKLKALLVDDKVNVEGVITDNDRPTTLKTRIFAGRGLHQQVLRIDRERIDDIEGEVKDKVQEFIAANIDDVDGIIIEDYGKGVIAADVIGTVLDKHKNKIVAVDPKENHLELYKNVSLITPNHHEAANMVGFDIDSDETLLKAGEKLLKEEKAEIILITLGEKGMMVFQKKGRPELIPTLAQEVSDVSGAGDTVIAVYTLALVSGATPIMAANIANCAAGVVVAKAGPAVVQVDELVVRIKKLTKEAK